MKKAQATIGQIFIFIIAIVIVAALFLFGYKAVATLKEKSDQVEYIQFENGLTNAIDTISLEFGSVSNQQIPVPGDITKVCFVTSYPDYVLRTGTGYPLIEDSVRSGAQKNVFLVGQDMKDSFYAGPIEVPGDFLCIDKTGALITVRLEGAGDHAIVS